MPKKCNTRKDIVKIHKNELIDGKWIKTEKCNFDNYVYNNFNTIKSYTKINESLMEVERITSDQSYSRGHIGTLILSYSKRIMNEVFDIANTNSIPIYYTDTDSMHLPYDDVAKLEEKFEEEYGRVINGKRLGQFHIDFDLEGSDSEIYATKSVFLGKKSYIDTLECVNRDGSIVTGDHIRMKGITTEGLNHSLLEHKNYMNLYKHLANGGNEKFLLNPYNDSTREKKVLFDFKNNNVYTKPKFYRNVSFCNS